MRIQPAPQSVLSTGFVLIFDTFQCTFNSKKTPFLPPTQPEIRVPFGSVLKDVGTFAFYKNLLHINWGSKIALRRDDAIFLSTHYFDKKCHFRISCSATQTCTALCPLLMKEKIAAVEPRPWSDIQPTPDFAHTWPQFISAELKEMIKRRLQ